MSISVVIAAFNAEGFLERAVASALAENPLEVIVVNDASTDATLVVASALAAKDARVRIVALPANGGPSKARNAGFAAALGDWIAILDADDAFLPGRLARLAANTAEADVVADNIERYDYVAERAVGLGLAGDRQRRIDVHSFVGASRGGRSDLDWGLLKPMFRRDFLVAHALTYPETLRHGEDFVFLFRTLLAGARFLFLPEAGYRYTERVGALSGEASGLSRTQVDYDAMARDTLVLMEEPAVRADPALRDLLWARYRGIRAIDARRLAALYVGERRPDKLIGLILANPAAIGALWRILLRRLGKAGA